MPACWPCVQERRRENRPVEALLDDHSGPVPARVGPTSAVGAAGHALAGRIAVLLRCGLSAASDVGIPRLAAVAPATVDGRWCMGFGCHFETAVAMELCSSSLNSSASTGA